MGSYHIDVRFADGSRRRCRNVTGALGEACGVALALADEKAAGATDGTAYPAWIELFEGEMLHISISILPDMRRPRDGGPPPAS